MPPRKQEPPPPPPITYPARPMNGGRLEKAEPLDGEWQFRPKWNGRRVLCHTPTMRTWNRQLEEVGYVHPAFRKLHMIVSDSDLWPPVIEWLDLEFLWGRSSVGKGAIIVLDYCSGNEPWKTRMFNLSNMGFHRLGGGPRGLAIPEKETVYFGVPIPNLEHPQVVWDDMQIINAEEKTTLFEGLVAYNINEPYPIQLFGPKRETRHWIKYRFID